MPPEEARETRVDVVVAGAGLSGLAAARRLRRGGLDVRVLEARARAGGRVLSRSVPGLSETRLDLGAQWIGPGHERMAELAEEAGVERYPTRERGRTILDREGEVRTLEPGELPGGEEALEAYLRMVERLEEMAREVDPRAPWEAERARGRDARTVAAWLDEQRAHPGARWLLETGLRTVLACELHEVSLLHLLFYARASGGLQYLMDTEGGAQAEQFREGAGAVVEHLVETLDDDIRCHHPVRRIVRHRGGVWFEGRRFRVAARYGIVALPPTLAGRLEYAPPLPAGRDQLTQRVPAGSVLKFHAVYEDPFWREEGLSGLALTDRGPFRVIFDGGAPDDERGFLVGFLEGNEAREASEWDEKRRRRAVLEGLRRLFGRAAAKPRHYVDRDWSQERFTRGCYGAFFPPGTWTGFGRYLRRPVGPLHWAGTETARAYAGYMEGAIRAGERAADRILGRRTETSTPGGGAQGSNSPAKEG